VRYIVFLRAINVGGHVVTMAELKKIFVAMGFKSVETFIASGNVIIDSKSADARALEKKIEAGLKKNLGYEVATFLRTEAEVAGVAAHRPFDVAAMEKAAALNVAFADCDLAVRHAKAVEAFRTGIDDFAIRGREIYWMCSVKQSESRFVSARMEKALGIKLTWRNVNTVRRLADKYPASADP
jgi:uncharacterized protein (DUF1697 family)